MNSWLENNQFLSGGLTLMLFGGAMAISPSDASAEQAPGKGDLETARLFGKRVADAAAKLKA